jgi:hypothetical protein
LKFRILTFFRLPSFRTNKHYLELQYDGTPVSSIGENTVALPQKVWAKQLAKPRPFYERRQSEDA